MRKYKIGLQLYSVREDVEKDMDATLKAVAEMGYECVEFAGYYGHSAEEVKAMCDKYNLEIASVHQSYDVFLDDTENSINYLKTLGVKYSAIPHKAEWETKYNENVEEIKQVGRILKDNGIQLLYHNHDFELTQMHNGKRVLDSLYADVDNDLLRPELDLCWVHYAGCDPIEYIKKYSDLEEVIHIKDFDCKNLNAGAVYALIDSSGKEQTRRDKEQDGFEFRPVGYGRQNVKALLEAIDNTEIKYVIVEQDRHTEHSPLEDAKISLDYIRSIVD